LLRMRLERKLMGSSAARELAERRVPPFARL